MRRIQKRRERYKNIYKLIQINRKKGIISDILNPYFLEVWLEILQTKEKYLTEIPINEAKFSKNDFKVIRNNNVVIRFLCRI
ncbi:hypothetical protein B1F79_00235 [Coxiella-like endosymbiont of Rhipicephalus sanguineus]|nr:hypothetical protein [Coxiella-like endosymbiont of Rhipicephalus sanguineus]